MPLIDQIRENKLIELAKARFDPDLKPAELKVLHDSASPSYPRLAAKGAPRPEIRPDFVRWLATDEQAASSIDPRGLRIWGMTLPGKLDLAECRVFPTLSLRRCTFEDEIDMKAAEARAVYVFLSDLRRGLRGNGLVTHSGFLLRRSTCQGAVHLVGAQIGGNLDCSGTKFTAQDDALWLDGAEINGDVFLKIGFEAAGEIRLLGAKIKGNLEFSGANLNLTAGDALSADGAEIGGDAVLNKGFESSGTVRLPGAKIKGNLDFTGEKLKVTGGDALFADGVEIGGDVFLREGFESGATIRVPGAKIKGDLDCSGATLGSTKGVALTASRAEIGGDVFLNNGFEATGRVRLPGARIGGDLDFFGAKRIRVQCNNLQLAGDLEWMSIQEPEEAYLELTGARLKNLRDDRNSWPPAKRLVLDGLAYEELILHEPPLEDQAKGDAVWPEIRLEAEERIEWLMLQTLKRRSEPQPWMQLRDLLERKGDRKGAKHVLYKFRCLQAENRWFFRRKWAIVFAWLEEAPIRILYSITFAVLLGWLVFGYAGAKRVIAPTGAEAYMEYAENRTLPATYPEWNSFIYTLENAVPLAKLGEDEKWAPDPNRVSNASFTDYRFLMWFRWLLILFGWFQAAVLGAALLRRFKE